MNGNRKSRGVKKPRKVVPRATWRKKAIGESRNRSKSQKQGTKDATRERKQHIKQDELDVKSGPKNLFPDFGSDSHHDEDSDLPKGNSPFPPREDPDSRLKTDRETADLNKKFKELVLSNDDEPQPEDIDDLADKQDQSSVPIKSAAAADDFIIDCCKRRSVFSTFRCVAASAALVGLNELVAKTKPLRALAIAGSVAAVTFAATCMYNAYTKVHNDDIHVTNSAPVFSVADLIAHNNTPPKICISSLFVESVELLGIHTTNSTESRPIRHQAARVDKQTKVHVWKVNRNGLSRTYVVNGTLLNEILSDHHSDETKARRIALHMKTKNVCHLMIPPTMQAILNPNTIIVASFFLNMDF